MRVLLSNAHVLHVICCRKDKNRSDSRKWRSHFMRHFQRPKKYPGVRGFGVDIPPVCRTITVVSEKPRKKCALLYPRRDIPRQSRLHTQFSCVPWIKMTSFWEKFRLQGNFQHKSFSPHREQFSTMIISLNSKVSISTRKSGDYCISIGTDFGEPRVVPSDPARLETSRNIVSAESERSKS